MESQPERARESKITMHWEVGLGKNLYVTCKKKINCTLKTRICGTEELCEELLALGRAKDIQFVQG